MANRHLDLAGILNYATIETGRPLQWDENSLKLYHFGDFVASIWNDLEKDGEFPLQVENVGAGLPQVTWPVVLRRTTGPGIIALTQIYLDWRWDRHSAVE